MAEPRFLTLKELVQDIKKDRQFYIIEVVDLGRLRRCYLGTQNMSMLCDPIINGDENLSVRWIITHEEAPGVETNTLTMFSIRNHVTKKSDDPTHLRVGEKFESDTYRLSLTGAKQIFHFMSNNIDSVDFKICTQRPGTHEMVYLMKRPDSLDIVAVPDQHQGSIFRIPEMRNNAM